MNDSNRLEASFKRLAVALDNLEAASERRASVDRLRVDQEEALSVMQDDRSRLANELDGALARVRRLDEANGEAMRRLHSAGAALRALLTENELGERD